MVPKAARKRAKSADTQAPTAVEAWIHDIRAQELILNLQVTEAISKLVGDNLRILYRVALEKRLHKIASA